MSLFVFAGSIEEREIINFKKILEEESLKNETGPLEDLFIFESLSELSKVTPESLESHFGQALDGDQHIWIATEESLKEGGMLYVYCRAWIRKKGRKGMNPQTGEIFQQAACDGILRLDSRQAPIEENAVNVGIESSLPWYD